MWTWESDHRQCLSAPTLQPVRLDSQRRVTDQGHQHHQHHPWKADGGRKQVLGGLTDGAAASRESRSPTQPHLCTASQLCLNQKPHLSVNLTGRERSGCVPAQTCALHRDANLARGPPWQGKKRLSNWLLFLGMVFAQVLILYRITFSFSLRYVCPWEPPPGSALKAQENDTEASQMPNPSTEIQLCSALVMNVMQTPSHSPTLTSNPYIPKVKERGRITQALRG